MDPLEHVTEQGWCLVPGALHADEVATLRAAFTDEGVGHTEHVEVTDATPAADLWWALAGRPPLGELAGALLGHRIEVSVHGRNPRPGGGDQGLHADQPATPGGAIRALTALWFLDPFTADNGATRVVPGSHRRRIAVPRDRAQPGQRHPGEVIVTGNPGDVLVFDAHLWHSGRRNRSGGGRRSVQMTLTKPARQDRPVPSTPLADPGAAHRPPRPTPDVGAPAAGPGG